MKKVLLTCVAAAVFLFSATVANAESIIKVTIDSDPVLFDANYGQPFLDENNRTQVPLRAVLEKFGAKVEWNNSTKTAIVSKDDTIVKIPVGTDKIIINDVEEKIDTKSLISNGRTYLPIRAVVEAFGATVEWDAREKKVVITTQKIDTKDVLLKAFEKSKAWKSYDMNTYSGQWADIVVEGSTVSLSEEITETYTVFCEGNNLKIKGQVNHNVTVLDVPIGGTTGRYIITDGNSMNFYQLINNDETEHKWINMEIDDKTSMDKVFRNLADILEETGKLIKDAGYYEYYDADGRELIEIYTVLSTEGYNPILVEALTSSNIVKEDQLEQIIDEVLSLIGDLPCAMWVDKETGEFAGYSVDIDPMCKAVASCLRKSNTEMDITDIDTIERMTGIYIRSVSNIGEAAGFEIPANARNNAIKHKGYLTYTECYDLSKK